MLKVLCLLAIVVVVASMPHAPQWNAPGPLPIRRIVKRDVQEPSVQVQEKDAAAPGAEMDDMDKAETFGFGYHSYYAYPRYYYPSYYYGYYPRYSYGYYW
uniref:Uncharacterized protein n=1 Tax=Anopheles farauti TaxID=69004 RepID=A0A182R197_9DIPT